MPMIFTTMYNMHYLLQPNLSKSFSLLHSQILKTLLDDSNRVWDTLVTFQYLLSKPIYVWMGRFNNNMLLSSSVISLLREFEKFLLHDLKFFLRLKTVEDSLAFHILFPKSPINYCHIIKLNP